VEQARAAEQKQRLARREDARRLGQEQEGLDFGLDRGAGLLFPLRRGTSTGTATAAAATAATGTAAAEGGAAASPSDRLRRVLLLRLFLRHGSGGSGDGASAVSIATPAEAVCPALQHSADADSSVVADVVCKGANDLGLRLFFCRHGIALLRRRARRRWRSLGGFGGRRRPPWRELCPRLSLVTRLKPDDSSTRD